MPIHPLTWILAGLFLLFGVIMLTAEGEPALRLWAGLSTLSLGGFALSMSNDARRSGTLRLQHSVIRRARRPRLFLAMTSLIAAAGAGVVIVGLWILIWKT